MPLDIVIPDLVAPADAPERLRSVRLHALERWLARADIETVPAEGPHGWLAAAYALPSPAPEAAIALAGEGRAQPGAWLRADPVHLRIDHDALMLHDAAILGVSKPEADSLVAALQRHFCGDGLEFQAPAAERWYVRATAQGLPATTPLWKAFGRNIFGLLPEGGGSVSWRSALTEAQMVLSAHEVNESRAKAGKPPINSVWFWGEGSTPAHVPQRHALVYASDMFARGLGTLGGAQVRALPGAIGDIDLVREGADVLAVIDTLTAPLHRTDTAAWLEEAQSLEASWFAKLADAVARFGTVRIILPVESGTRVATLTGAARWRMFRPRKPLAAHA
jgi:hypothetical protein